MQRLPRGFLARAAGRSPRTACMSRRCSESRRATSAFQARASGALPEERENQLLPFSVKVPRFSPVSIRRTAYFQYAA